MKIWSQIQELPALGHAAVHRDGDAAAGVRQNLVQVAGAGDAGFGAQMGDFHGFRG